jgi:hypothetical protein
MFANGTSVKTIRKSLKSKVDTLPDDIVVAVWTLLAGDIQHQKERKRTAEWLEHPWEVPGFKPIPRDALYDRI